MRRMEAAGNAQAEQEQAGQEQRKRQLFEKERQPWCAQHRHGGRGGKEAHQREARDAVAVEQQAHENQQRHDRKPGTEGGEQEHRPGARAGIPGKEVLRAGGKHACLAGAPGKVAQGGVSHRSLRMRRAAASAR